MNWQHCDKWVCEVGSIELMGGEWVGRVTIGGQSYRLNETFVSAEVAKGAVQRTYDREMQKMVDGWVK